MINREQALELIKDNLKNGNMIKHSLAVGFVMEHLAEKYGEDVDKWYITGLLHDVDYDETYELPEKHGLVAMDILKDYELTDDMLYAIKAHGGNFSREDLLSKCLYAADPITGLITAAAILRPDKTIANIKLKSLKKKYKTARFAAGANREQIASCSEFDMELDEFLQLSLDAMARNQESLI